MFNIRIIQLIVPAIPSKFKIQSQFIQIDKIFDLIEQAFMQIRMKLIKYNEFKIPSYKEAVTDYIRSNYDYDIGNKFDRMLTIMAMATDVKVYQTVANQLIKSLAFTDIIVQVIKNNFQYCDIIIPSSMRSYGIRMSSMKYQDIQYIGIYNKPKDQISLKTFDKKIKI